MTHENLHAASATRHCFYLADIALFIGLAGSSMKSDGALTSNAAIQLYLGLRDAGAQVEHIRHIWPHASPSSLPESDCGHWLDRVAAFTFCVVIDQSRATRRKAWGTYWRDSGARRGRK